MKILRIIARLNVGGPARHVVWLTKELNTGEFASTMIAGTVPGGEEDMAYLAAEHGVVPILIPEMSRELSLKDAVSLFKVYREIKRHRPDIIHTHTAKAGTVGRLAALMYRWFSFRILIGKPRQVRVVHTFHGHVFHSYYSSLKSKTFVSIERFLARFATDKIITITDQQFEEIHHRFGVGKANQFEIIPLGIDLEPFIDDGTLRSMFRSEIGASHDEILIGFVGRLTEIKNIPMLLKAAAMVLAEQGTDDPRVRFIIAGDGHLRQDLETEAETIGIANSVVFLGNRTDINAVYLGLDIVALTSLNEGTPLSLIEGMAANKPIISTMVGGVVDLLGNAESVTDYFTVCERGIGVPTNSPASFAKGLIYLTKDEKLREGLGDRGRSFVVAKYSKSRLVKDIKDLYRRLV